MGVMRAVGTGHRLPANAKVRVDAREYVIELDVSDFLESELEVELVGTRITVRGDQLQDPGDDGIPFRLQERLEESFRLPDDVRTDGIRVWYGHGTLEIRAPRTRREPRTVPIEHRSPYVGSPDAVPC
jgi:HSP20 family molecular chaperone IbpA